MNKRSLILVAILAVALVMSALAMAQEDEKPFLGIGIQSSEDGAVITAIQPESPAALAGLKEGDIITAVNGSDVTADDIAGAIQALSVGDTITLNVLRDGESLELQAKLVARPAQPDVNVQVFPMGNRPYLGVALEDVDASVTISEVNADSPAAEAGLQADDVLVSINGTAVENTRAAIEAIRSLEVGDTVTLEVQRGDETLTLEATLGSMFEQGQFMMPGGAEMLDIVVYNYEAGAWQVFGLADENPLAEAGLQQGDVITLIDGETYDPPALEDYLGELTDDAQVTLTIERNGETQDITVPASALDSLMTFDFRFSPEIRGGRRGGRDILPESMLMGGARLGVGFEMVDEGARITEIVPDSPAAEAGLQVDDVVTAVNDEAVDEEHTLRDRMFAYEPGDTVTLAVTRGSETLSLDITLEEFSLGEMLPFGDNRGFFDMIPRPFGRDGRMPDVPEQPAQPSV